MVMLDLQEERLLLTPTVDGVLMVVVPFLVKIQPKLTDPLLMLLVGLRRVSSQPSFATGF